MLKRTLLSISAAALIGTSMAQSDGGDFDVAVVLVPGMTVERNGVIYGGDYSNGTLQAGDIVRTGLMEGDRFYMLTSDGSVIAINPNSEILMDGSRLNWDVFQVNRGAANIAGNVQNGFALPAYYNQYASMVSRNIAADVNNAATPGYVDTTGGNTYYATPYANVVNTPAYGVIDPYGLASRAALGNFYMTPWNSGVVLSSPWWWN